MSSTDQLIQHVRSAAEYVDGVTGDYEELEIALGGGNMAEAVDLANQLADSAAAYQREVAAMRDAVTSAAGG